MRHFLWKFFFKFILKPLAYFDAYVLYGVEKAAHSIQRTFGIGPQRQAQLVYGLYVALMVVAFVIPAFIEKHWWKLAGWCALILPMIWCYAVMMPKSAKTLEDMNALGYANPRKGSFLLFANRMYLMLFGFFFLFAGSILLDLQFLMLTLSSYLEACDTLPPGQSRVRKLLESMRYSPLVPAKVNR